MSQKRGRFIVLEGTDGSGTTTQCRLLCRRLSEAGVVCVETREPTDGPVGRLLRAALEKRLDGGSLDWTTLALLFAADRTWHVDNEILPALQRGHWVVSDRYTLSSLIYQTATAPDPDAARGWIEQINARALVPDVTIVLDVPASVAESRRAIRGGPEELFDKQELQQRLARAYLEAERYDSSHIVHVDGSAALEAVAAEVHDEVTSRWCAGEGAR
ncbi:MAG: dTMP kinase [Polyangiaceae bacterium]